MSDMQLGGLTIRDRKIFWQRIVSFCIFTILIIICYQVANTVSMIAPDELHTILEIIATLIAFMISTLALIRYYSRKTNLFLFLGTGFFWTGVFDSFHAIATSDFISISNQDFIALKVWSWSLSRFYIAVMLLVMWVMWRRDKYQGEAPIKNVGTIYFISGLVAISMIFLSMTLPYPDVLFAIFKSRPLEFIPGFIFAIPLVGFIVSQHWRRKHFYFWLIMGLIASFLSQTPFMFSSSVSNDTMSFAAHIVKIISYAFILIGILISVYYLFLEVEQNRRRLAKQYKEIKKANSQVEEILEKETASRERIEKLNRYMTGRELKMVELKKEVEKLKKERDNKK